MATWSCRSSARRGGLVSEPEHGNLAEAMHHLTLSFSKRAKSLTGAQVSVQTKDANLGHRAN